MRIISRGSSPVHAHTKLQVKDPLRRSDRVLSGLPSSPHASHLELLEIRQSAPFRRDSASELVGVKPVAQVEIPRVKLGAPSAKALHKTTQFQLAKINRSDRVLPILPSSSMLYNSNFLSFVKTATSDVIVPPNLLPPRESSSRFVSGESSLIDS